MFFPMNLDHETTLETIASVIFAGVETLDDPTVADAAAEAWVWLETRAHRYNSRGLLGVLDAERDFHTAHTVTKITVGPDGYSTARDLTGEEETRRLVGHVFEALCSNKLRALLGLPRLDWSLAQ